MAKKYSDNPRTHYIKKFLDDHAYDYECVDSLDKKEISELYNLYVYGNLKTNTQLYGYYGVYFLINNKYDQMVVYDVLAVEKQHDDEGPLQRLYDYWKTHHIDTALINRVCNVLQKHHLKGYDKFNKLRQLNTPKIVKPSNQQQNDNIFKDINTAIDQSIQDNDLNRVCELYDVCTNDQEKTLYLSKVVTIKDFKPTKEMIQEIMRLEFDLNASLEVRLIKAIFSGSKI